MTTRRNREEGTGRGRVKELKFDEQKSISNLCSSMNASEETKENKKPNVGLSINEREGEREKEKGGKSQ
jgi:hypothetical protein